MSNVQSFVEGLRLTHVYDTDTAIGDDQSKWNLVEPGVRRVTVGTTPLKRADLGFTAAQWADAAVIEFVPVLSPIFILDQIDGDPLLLGKSVAAGTSAYVASPVDVFQLKATVNTDVIVRLYGDKDRGFLSSERIPGGLTILAQTSTTVSGGAGTDTFITSFSVVNGVVTATTNTGSTLAPFSIGVGSIISTDGSVTFVTTNGVADVQVVFADAPTAIVGISTTTAINPATLKAVLDTRTDEGLIDGSIDLATLAALPAADDGDWFRVGTTATIGGVIFTADEWYKNETGAAIAAGSTVAIATAWTKTKDAGVAVPTADGVLLDDGGEVDLATLATLPAANLGDWFRVGTTATIGGVVFTAGEWWKNQTGVALASGNSAAIASSWTRVKTAANSDKPEIFELDIATATQLPAGDQGDIFKIVSTNAAIKTASISGYTLTVKQKHYITTDATPVATSANWARFDRIDGAPSLWIDDNSNQIVFSDHDGAEIVYDGAFAGEAIVLAASCEDGDAFCMVNIDQTNARQFQLNGFSAAVLIDEDTAATALTGTDTIALPPDSAFLVRVSTKESDGTKVATIYKKSGAVSDDTLTPTIVPYTAHGQAVGAIHTFVPFAASYDPDGAGFDDGAGGTTNIHLTDGEFAIDFGGVYILDGGGAKIPAPQNVVVVSVPDANSLGIASGERAAGVSNGKGFLVPLAAALKRAHTYYVQTDGTTGEPYTEFPLFQVDEDDATLIRFSQDGGLGVASSGVAATTHTPVSRRCETGQDCEVALDNDTTIVNAFVPAATTAAIEKTIQITHSRFGALVRGIDYAVAANDADLTWLKPASPLLASDIMEINYIV